MLLPRLLQGRPDRDDLRLLHRERAVEDAQVGYAAAAEVPHLQLVAAAPAPRPAAAELQRQSGPDAADGLGEVLASRRLDRVSIAEDVHPGALAGAVVGDHDVRPLAGRQPPEVAGRDTWRRTQLTFGVQLAGHPERELPRSDVHRPAAIAVFRVVLPRDDVVALLFGLVDPERDGIGRAGVERHRRETGPGLAVEPQRRMSVRAGFDLRPALEGHRMLSSTHLEHGPAVGVQIEPHPLRPGVERRPQVPVLAGREPLGEGRVDRRRAVRHPRLDLGGLFPQGVPEIAILLLRHDQDGRRIGDVAVHHVLRRIAEERRHRVELALPDRVELVIVAGGAADGQPHEDVAYRLGPVLGIDRLVLLRNDPALVGRDVVALEPGGDELIQARLGQQVAGELLHGELVERLVPVEGPDHPVAVGIHLSVVVDVDPVRVAVARRVEPVAGTVLAPLLRGEQPVDELLVGVRRRIVQERIQQRRGRRQAGQVQRRPARQRPPVGLRRRVQPRCLQPRVNEVIERIARPARVGHRRRLGADDRLERPVLIPRSALRDPAPHNVDLVAGQRLVGVRRRHPQPRVGLRDALEDQAGIRVAANDGPAVRTLRKGALLGVQPQPNLPRALVGPVALEAVVRQDRPHVSLEIDGRRGRILRGGGRRGSEKRPRKDQESAVEPRVARRPTRRPDPAARRGSMRGKVHGST